MHGFDSFRVSLNVKFVFSLFFQSNIELIETDTEKQITEIVLLLLFTETNILHCMSSHGTTE